MYQVLESRTNQFRGVEVRPDALPEEPFEFRRRLDNSLKAWRSEGLLAVWLHVPIDRSALIPVAVEAGFTFHHSGDDYLMLTHRLVEDAHIPPYATHFIGAGGVVINDQQELQVVRERYAVGSRPPALKLPGGALLPESTWSTRWCGRYSRRRGSGPASNPWRASVTGTATATANPTYTSSAASTL